MRILVIGGDAFTDPRGVFMRMDGLIREALSSGASHAVLIWPEDSRAGDIADSWARKRGFITTKWPAPAWWNREPIILKDGAPDVIVAYPGAPRFLLRKAKRLGLRLIEAT